MIESFADIADLLDRELVPKETPMSTWEDWTEEDDDVATFVGQLRPRPIAEPQWFRHLEDHDLSKED